MRYYSGPRNVFVSILTSVGTFLVLAVLFLGYIGMNDTGIQKNESAQKNQAVPSPQQISTNIIKTQNVPIADVVSQSVQPVVGIAALRPDGNTLFKADNNENWGLGSGVIVDSRGYILTNSHIAGEKSQRIVVTLTGGDSVDGVCLWSDAVMDLAIVKINVTGLPVIKLGDSGSLKIGESAIAVGNPLGLQFQRTVTAGIVSALNRTVQVETDQGTNYMEDLIQTDASINPGNSGGPLLNSKGEVIGINTIKVASAEGIGFAIPINIAKPIVDSFIQTGTFEQPYLGLFAYDKEVMPYIQPNIKMNTGIYVTKMDYNSPAALGGIKVGDILTKVDDKEVHTMLDLRSALYKKKPGDAVKIHLIRNEQVKTVDLRLGKKNGDELITR